MYNSTTHLSLSLVGFENLLRQVQLTGGKPQVLQLIIPDPFHQVLHLPMNEPMLLYSVNFILFFAINFHWWRFVVESVGPVVS